MEHPPKKFFRLSPGTEVRLRYSFIIRCERVVKDESGTVVEVRCTADLDSLDGPTATRRVKGTIHWVSAAMPWMPKYVYTIGSFDPKILERAVAIRWTTSTAVTRAPRGLQGRGVTRDGHSRLAVPVRTPWLLLRRCRLARGRAGLQPDGHAEGHLGQDRRTLTPALRTPTALRGRDVVPASRVRNTAQPVIFPRSGGRTPENRNASAGWTWFAKGFHQSDLTQAAVGGIEHAYGRPGSPDHNQVRINTTCTSQLGCSQFSP